MEASLGLGGLSARLCAMGRRIQAFFGNRIPNRVDHMNAMARANHRRRGLRSSKRARGMPRNEQLPFVPPEDWHEPQEGGGYGIVVRHPGAGYRHVVTTEEIRGRLSELPVRFLEPLQTVQLSGMTRKKLSFPCYGMQWGPTIYLYPVEVSLVERYKSPPKPAQLIEAKMYGGRWEETAGGGWTLVWTEAALKDFYL